MMMQEFVNIYKEVSSNLAECRKQIEDQIFETLNEFICIKEQTEDRKTKEEADKLCRILCDVWRDIADNMIQKIDYIEELMYPGSLMKQPINQNPQTPQMIKK